MITPQFGLTVDMPVFDEKAFKTELTKACRKVLVETAIRGNKMLRPLVAKWDHKVTFSHWLLRPQGMVFAIEFGPVESEAADIFAYSDLGVQPHMIFPVRSRDGLLHYRKGFTPKTRPGSLVSGPGARSGPWVSRKAVAWPGITPRGFTDTMLANLAMGWGRDIEVLVDTFASMIVEAKLERIVEVKTYE